VGEQWVRLAERAKDGDIEAFGRLVDRFKGPLCAAIYPMVRDWHSTQDLAQDVFVAAYRGLDDLRDPRKFRSWLYTIAKNRTVSLLRRESLADIRSIERVDEGELLPLPGQPRCRIMTGSEDGRLSRTAAERMRRAILALPNDYGTLLVMRHVEGMPVADMAEALGRPQKSVKAALHRARVLAKDMLHKSGLTMERMLNEL
jgi:RNA polymerase sigma-70 factor (ECF subfamily)